LNISSAEYGKQRYLPGGWIAGRSKLRVHGSCSASDGQSFNAVSNPFDSKLKRVIGDDSAFQPSRVESVSELSSGESIYFDINRTACFQIICHNKVMNTSLINMEGVPDAHGRA
jgi:hypothetical protein